MTRFVAEIGDTLLGERRLDVTEAVKMLYDGLVNSMDWGSEFLDTDTKAAVLGIGLLLGSETPAPGNDYRCMAEAGFTEPAPSRIANTTKYDSPEFVAWYDNYKAWEGRKKEALMRWSKEVAAQTVAKMQEV